MLCTEFIVMTQTPIFDSYNTAYKNPFGAVKNGASVTFTLRVPQSFGCSTPYFIINKQNQESTLHPMQKIGTQQDYDVFSISYTPNCCGLFFYYFDLYTEYRKIFKGALGSGYITTQDGPRWQLTVYDAHFTTPSSVKGGVMYQIFPDRFYEGSPNKEMPYADRIYRANKLEEPYFWPTENKEGYLNRDYYGGDFLGIMQKLPYLKSLGVTHIYLNPIFEAHANHRYNTANYLKADPLLGTNEDFAKLCGRAKEMDIAIILDGVFSHTGSDSIYFNREGRYPSLGAYQSEFSPYRRWYDFNACYPCGYRSWWGFETLPEVNENDTGYRDFICGENGVIDYWLKQGASGFRLDVADELPDDFIELIRKAVKRRGDDKLLIGEVWEDATTKEAYGVQRTYLLGKGLDTVMNYPFRNAIIKYIKYGDAANCAAQILDICEHYPAPALHTLMNFLSTHDTERAITNFAGESCEGHDRYWQSGRWLSHNAYQYGKKLMKLAFALLFFLPGIPSIYYGDEIYMQGYKDPFNRGYFNWNSTETDLVAEITTLSKARQNCPAFKDGTLSCETAQNGILVLHRHGSSSAATLALNRTDSTVSLTINGSSISIPSYSYRLFTH